MKYILTYKAKQKNARRHVYQLSGQTVYFNSIEQAKQEPFYKHPLYTVEVLTANYKPVKGAPKC